MIKLSTFNAIFMSDYRFDFCSFNCRATYWPPCILKTCLVEPMRTRRKLQRGKRFRIRIKSLFSPRGKIYGLVHIGRQPEREIYGKKRLENTMGKKRDMIPGFLFRATYNDRYAEKSAESVFLKSKAKRTIDHRRSLTGTRLITVTNLTAHLARLGCRHCWCWICD